jgi:hypothetical protein
MCKCAGRSIGSLAEGPASRSPYPWVLRLTRLWPDAGLILIVETVIGVACVLGESGRSACLR